MLRYTFVFISLSLMVTGWLTYELGILSFTKVAASEAETPEGIESLTRSLKERTTQLQAKEAELSRREQTVADKEVVFTQQIERYESIVKGLKQQVEKLEGMNDSRVAAYRKIYEKMDPKKTAQVFDDMDPALVSEILGEMRPQISVDILAKMSIRKVRLLTEKFLTKRLPASSKKKVNEADEAGQ